MRGTADEHASRRFTGLPWRHRERHDVANTTVAERGDLSVTKTHTGTTTPGGTPTYTITINNGGPSDATGVQLTDNAPANVTFGTVTVASVPAGISTCNPAPTSTSVACLWSRPS